jgi:ATP-binding cassette subfamily B protein
MTGKWRLLGEQMRGQRLRYGAALAALVLGVAIGYLAPLVVRTALDGALGGQPADLPPPIQAALAPFGGCEALARNLWLAGLALVVVVAASGLCHYLRGRWSATAAEAIARRVRDRLYDHLQHLPCRYHDRANPGDLIQRCTSDVETVRMFLSSQVVEIGRAVVLLGTAIPLMLWLDWRMTLVSLAVIPPIVAFSIIFSFKVRKAFKLADEAEGDMTARLQENLTGIRVVRAFARQEHEIAKFAEKNALYRDRSYRLIRILSLFWSTSDFMCMLQNGLVLLCGAHWMARGELTVGTLFAFLAYVNMFLWPVRHMGRVLTQASKTAVSLGRLHEVLTTPRESAAGSDPLTPVGQAFLPVRQTGMSVLPAEAESAPARAAEAATPRGEIVFEDITFGHDHRKVLDGLTLRIPPGQVLALLGTSGTGKSTLMHLLLRLYDYEHGSIRLDGREVKELPRKDVRAQVSAVLQEPFLFSRSLRENIRLGRARATDEEVQQAAAVASVHQEILEFERGYDTLVGERGVMLSGGQRQRVALARALIRDPAVLVLDDALSAVDTETEAWILQALDDRRGRRTTILIAHRLSTLAQADRIVVLDRGRIVQDGCHAELVQADGLYRRLWQIQNALEEDLGRELQAAGAGGQARGPAEVL